jgi:hypothetical protein
MYFGESNLLDSADFRRSDRSQYWPMETRQSGARRLCDTKSAELFLSPKTVERRIFDRCGLVEQEPTGCDRGNDADQICNQARGDRVSRTRDAHGAEIDGDDVKSCFSAPIDRCGHVA